MKILSLFILFSFSFLSSLFANDYTVDESFFKPENSLTWAYSEWSEEQQEWQEPYIYETYFIREVSGTKITIEMSSSSKLNQTKSPHHKFIANVAKCKSLGKDRESLKRFKIIFFTKSIDSNWTLLSKSYKPLAFTEKFNCLHDESDFEIKDLSTEFESFDKALVWKNFPVQSWYLLDNSGLKGVAVKREVKNYSVRLVKINNQHVN